MLGVGICLLPLGLGAPAWLGVTSFALAGVSWAPYQATAMALFQRVAPAGRLAPVLAANSAVALLAAPAGVAAGGVLVGWWGAQVTLLASGLATITLGLGAALLVRTRSARATAGSW
ncbi:MFS transporter [Kineosporia succinea]|uniref:MFS transporter n=1 Tax=Kineosporia succinea TaxID=84632 RepID=A0ABT9PGD7_9ACTN|nr:hypothetical protein [Kineosporia succinea]MDP9831020.1 hypothetical protein [Kineosporia succinea]